MKGEFAKTNCFISRSPVFLKTILLDGPQLVTDPTKAKTHYFSQQLPFLPSQGTNGRCGSSSEWSPDQSSLGDWFQVDKQELVPSDDKWNPLETGMKRNIEKKPFIKIIYFLSGQRTEIFNVVFCISSDAWMNDTRTVCRGKTQNVVVRAM